MSEIRDNRTRGSRISTIQKNTSKWAAATLKTALCGIRYYYKMMLNVNWELFRIAKFSSENKLSTVLTKEEVDKILRCARPFNNYVYLVLVYSCGLRLSEALNIEVSDIDRGNVHTSDDNSHPSLCTNIEVA